MQDIDFLSYTTWTDRVTSHGRDIPRRDSLPTSFEGVEAGAVKHLLLDLAAVGAPGGDGGQLLVIVIVVVMGAMVIVLMGVMGVTVMMGVKGVMGMMLEAVTKTSRRSWT